MQTPIKTEFIDLTTAGAPSSTYQLRIRPRRLLLERIRIIATVVIASNATQVDNHLFNFLFKKIRLTVKDRDGNPPERINCSGVGIIADQVRADVPLTAKQVIALNDGGTTTNVVTLDIPIRPWDWSEVVANRASIPLWNLTEDALLELDTGALTDAAGTFTITGNVTFQVQLFMREPVLQADGQTPIRHLPTALVSDSYTWPGTGERKYQDFPRGGFLLTLLTYHLNSAAAANPLAAGAKWVLKHGETPRIELTADASLADNDQLSAYHRVLASGADTFDIAGACNFYDLLNDQPNTDAFAPGSAWNLNNGQGEGGLPLELMATNIGTAMVTHFVHRKLLTKSVDDLKLLIGG